MQRILLSILLLILSCNETTEPEDCAGIAGGTAELDSCGVCDSNFSNDCLDCSTYFSFEQSTSQAAYYFQEVSINEVTLSAEDLVAGFKGDICVGSQQWDTSLCGGGVCEVVLMGDTGSDLTDEYMLPGDIPTFKIYDVSEGVIYNTTSPDTLPSWANFGNSVISTLDADITSASPCKE